jgi:hypothetical protein
VKLLVQTIEQLQVRRPMSDPNWAEHWSEALAPLLAVPSAAIETTLLRAGQERRNGCQLRSPAEALAGRLLLTYPKAELALYRVELEQQHRDIQDLTSTIGYSLLVTDQSWLAEMSQRPDAPPELLQQLTQLREQQARYNNDMSVYLKISAALASA